MLPYFPLQVESIIRQHSAYENFYLGKTPDGEIHLLVRRSPITATGASVTENIEMLRPFRLLQIRVQHTTAVYVLTTDALTWHFRKMLALGAATNPISLVSYQNSSEHTFLEIFGEGYELEAGTYQFVQNTDNTDLVFFAVVVQIHV